ncbi:MAG TPA: antibiotic biosynthesis monooxygenase [Mycobacteriales bacterium]|nr:antibiotic biosynthesis monooxygenase [Mycobacteriales bacterium]
MGDASPLADTGGVPYTAVIFTSVRRPAAASPEYAATARRMDELAREQPGYLGIESAAADGVGVTVSYWASPAAARAWKAVAEHAAAQALGRERWYADYRVRIATVDRDYGP